MAEVPCLFPIGQYHEQSGILNYCWHVETCLLTDLLFSNGMSHSLVGTPQSFEGRYCLSLWLKSTCPEDAGSTFLQTLVPIYHPVWHHTMEVCNPDIYQSENISSLLYKSLTHSWSRALLEKPPIVQLLKNFPAFYGTRRFITSFT
jgi:hypothetical protein